MEKQVKEAWTSNEMNRTKIKATKKEKTILERLRNRAESWLMNNDELLQVKETWLEELCYRKVKLE